MKKLNMVAMLLGAALFMGLGAVSLNAQEAKCGVAKCGNGKNAKAMKCGDSGKCGKAKKAKSMKCGDSGKCGKAMKNKNCICTDTKVNPKCTSCNKKAIKSKCGGAKKAPASKCGKGKCGS
ncbi:hypothetical protein GJV85_12375 [Sulfurimonas aquatica]|uniref:Low-complexity protein n=1 Tax=Sulfurimonas aquatica TaxID=2672570 RepID=A0A975B2F6_9BACT|nr:hypothetical protein [Sulfurimonas aquatica]QSZ42870.1 hypothetical protein GJV85_12375 [Sulfurimonas aquatica]